jgi:hypothetical protein
VWAPVKIGFDFPLRLCVFAPLRLCARNSVLKNVGNVMVPDLAISVLNRFNQWTGFTGLCNSINSVNPEQSCKSCHFFGAGNGLYSLQSVQFSFENVFFY